MGNLTEHVMLDKWDNDINSAITKVGGDTSNSEGLPDYADIIKTQLVSNEAVGKGIYQDFLYVDEENNTSDLPWEGNVTNSTNAVQASTIANSIQQLYNTMALTERFNVLLVDEIPKSEINLSAVYLVRSNCCDDPECTCQCKENTYTGCYFIKTGKTIKKIDIPEFEVDLSELFFLTRAEYDANLSNYVKEIEDLLRKKFGKYWDDEGFALDKMIDQIVNELIGDLRAETLRIIEEFQQHVDEALEEVNEALAEVDGKISAVETELTSKFDQLEDNINNKVTDVETELTSKFDALEEGVNNKVSEVETNLLNKFDQLEDEITEDIVELRKDVEERVKVSDLVSLDNEINELK